MQVHFSFFHCVIFMCKWWHTFDWCNGKEDHDSGIICINSKNTWDESKEVYVFSKHCNQVYFLPGCVGQGLVVHTKTWYEHKTYFRDQQCYNAKQGRQQGWWQQRVICTCFISTFILWMRHFIMVIYNLANYVFSFILWCWIWKVSNHLQPSCWNKLNCFGTSSCLLNYD